MDSIHETYRKIDCRLNLRENRPTCPADCPYLYVASTFMHLTKCPLTWSTSGGGGTQIWDETIEFFIPLLTPCSDMMNPFLHSREFASRSSLRRAENPPDNGVFSIPLNWILYFNLCEITYLTDSYPFEFNFKLFILSCHTYLMPIQPVHLLTSTKTSRFLVVKHNSTNH